MTTRTRPATLRTSVGRTRRDRRRGRWVEKGGHVALTASVREAIRIRGRNTCSFRLWGWARQARHRHQHSVRRQRDLQRRCVRVQQWLLWHRSSLRTYARRGAHDLREGRGGGRSLDVAWRRPSHLGRPTSGGLVTRAPLLAVVCTNNVAPGYYFDASEVIPSGQNATTTTCPFGLAGYATRACLWNGPTSQYGVWAAPASFCLRTGVSRICTAAVNATARGLAFAPRLTPTAGSTAGRVKCARAQRCNARWRSSTTRRLRRSCTARPRARA